jgi:CRP/FNR family transcriptional regulator, nitrogen oxide reductase regulator
VSAAAFIVEPPGWAKSIGGLWCGRAEEDKDTEMKMPSAARQDMAASEILARVAKLAPKFFEGLRSNELAAVLKAATVRRFRANTVIATEGEPADKLFLVLEGRARTFSMTHKGEKLLLLWIPPGDPSGGRAFLPQWPMEYLVSTETVMNSLVLVWDRSAILALSKRYPRLMENALLVASDYLTAYRDLYVAANFHTARRRVAWTLEKLARGMGRPAAAGGIEVNVSNEDVAIEANVTIFTVSRLFSEWERKGLLVKSRRRVVIRSLEGFMADAN